MLGRRLAAAAERDLRGQGSEVRVRVIELRELATGHRHNLVTGFPNAKLADALNAVERADGVVAVSPIFSASYSGLFKSFFDLIDNKALSGTPVLIAATGGSARHSLALEHALRPLFAYLHAWSYPPPSTPRPRTGVASSGAESVDLAGGSSAPPGNWPR